MGQSLYTYTGGDTDFDKFMENQADEKTMREHHEDILEETATLLRMSGDVDQVSLYTSDISEHNLREKELIQVKAALQASIATILDYENRGRLYHLKKLVTG